MMEKTITLNEALCGCEFVVKHLDGQQLLVKTNPGEAITPGESRGAILSATDHLTHAYIQHSNI